MASHDMPITFETPVLYERDFRSDFTTEEQEWQDAGLSIPPDQNIAAQPLPSPAILPIPQTIYSTPNQTRNFTPQDPITFTPPRPLHDFIQPKPDRNGARSGDADERPFEVRARNGELLVPEKVQYRLGFHSVGQSAQHIRIQPFGRSKNTRCMVDGRQRSVTRLKIVLDVVKVVSEFFEKHGSTILCPDETGAIGPRDVRVEDLVLLEILHVSPGSWQPIFGLSC